MSKRSRILSTEERDFWTQIVRDVKPLKKKKIISDIKTENSFTDKNLYKTNKIHINSPVIRTINYYDIKKPYLFLDDISGIDRRTVQRFKRGKMRFDGSLDLHGMNRDTAYETLSRFLHRHIEQGSRCVLVITGRGPKGQGVLRQTLPEWLNSQNIRHFILSFCQAKIEHGGSGAFYILLKRKKYDRKI